MPSRVAGYLFLVADPDQFLAPLQVRRLAERSQSSPQPARARHALAARRENQKQRTRRALIEAALRLAGRGGQSFSIAEAAGAAQLSVATAYRYFPHPESLWAELAIADPVDIDDVLAAAGDDPAERVDAVVSAIADAQLGDEATWRVCCRRRRSVGLPEPSRTRRYRSVPPAAQCHSSCPRPARQHPSRAAISPPDHGIGVAQPALLTWAPSSRAPRVPARRPSPWLQLRSFLDGVRMGQLAGDNAISVSTGYAYLRGRRLQRHHAERRH